jgi:hypothetical protein
VCPALNPDEVEDHFLSFAWLNLTPNNRARVLSRAPKTFWLFGAGASHHYDLNAFGVPIPLANGFFEAFHRLPTSQGFQAGVGPSISFLQHYRGVRADEVHNFAENIEEFMTSIERELQTLKESKGGDSFTREQFERVVSYTQVFIRIVAIANATGRA